MMCFASYNLSSIYSLEQVEINQLLLIRLVNLTFDQCQKANMGIIHDCRCRALQRRSPRELLFIMDCIIACNETGYYTNYSRSQIIGKIWFDPFHNQWLYDVVGGWKGHIILSLFHSFHIITIQDKMSSQFDLWE